jgi:hypothetical protein
MAPNNEANAIFYEYGYHLLKRHYYVSIPEKAEIDIQRKWQPSQMVGVNTDSKKYLAFAKDTFGAFSDEFSSRFPLHRKTQNPTDFFLINEVFMAGDAHAYYSFLRKYKPKKLIEVGGGSSSLIALQAITKNKEEDPNYSPSYTIIEPYPPEWMKKGNPLISKVIEKKVQEVPLSVFEELGEGDILFIDSTHIVIPGGDVIYEICEILPRLKPGVFVHIHDISLPHHYPSTYADRHYYWTEQYLLQAFLSYNSNFEILWPGALAYQNSPDEVAGFFPGFDEMKKLYPQSEPSSFWMKRVT